MYHNAMLRYLNQDFYVDVDLEIHNDDPERRNHMTIKAKWRNIVAQCGFEPNKVVRFKIIDLIRDDEQTVDPNKPVMIPLIHMC